MIFLPSRFCKEPNVSDKINANEAEIVVDMLRRIHRFYGDRFDAQKTVGVIVPYRNQIAMVRKGIEKLGIPELEKISIDTVERYQGNLLYVARLAGLSGSLPSLAGGFGLFFEAALPSLEALPPLLPPKAQTLVCGGLEPSETAALLARAGARGVDRVVPLGQALEMDTVWDGRDLIAALSRIIG